MKKLKLLIVSIISVLSVACIDSDPSSVTFYIYKNQTSHSIMVDAYSPMFVNGELKDGLRETFELKIGDEYIFKSTTLGETFASKPLLYLYGGKPTGRDSVIITNGAKKIIQRSWWEGSFLYDKASYTFTQPSTYTGVFTYEFTDEFFTD